MTEHIGELISAYVDGECTPEERIQVEQHLNQCHSCQQIMNDVMEIQRNTSHIYQRLNIPKEIEQRVIITLDQSESSLFSWWIRGIFLFVIPLMIWIPFVKWGTTIATSFFHLFSNFLQIIPTLASAIPTLSLPSSIWAIFLLIISVWSLRRLLI